ncbi:MAG: ABC transporter ATP-binding protein/permease [Clostridiales bacterium]|nr:ABC transporter ATP-binding protein/permease [Clostridiales bacterium]
MDDKNKQLKEQQRRMQAGRRRGGGPAGALARPAEKVKDFKGTVKRLVKYLAPQKAKFATVAGLAVLSTAFSIIGPKIMGLATTKIGDGLLAKISWYLAIQEAQSHNYPASYIAKLQNQLIPSFDFGYIGRILILLAVLYALSALFSFLMAYLMATVSQTTVYTMRNDVKEKLNHLPLKFYDTHLYGDILSRVTNDMDTIAHTLQQSLTQLITSAVTLLGIFIMMMSISPLMTLIALVALPLSGLITMLIAKQSQKFFAGQQKYIGLVSGHVEEMYTGHKIVKLFGKENDSVEEFNMINDKLYEAGWKAQFMSGLIMPALNFVNNMGYVAVCVFGGFMVAKRLISIGDIQAFIQYMRTFTQPIVQTANIVNIIQSTVAAAERVFEILDEAEELPDPENAAELEETDGAVSFEHVHFGYADDKILMEDINIDVKPGQTVAVVGPTGAGKTTLVNLLMRFYELQGGRITIDGIKTTDMRRENVRNMFGMVLQDAWLFKGSIRDNIAYSRLDATDEEVFSAAKAAKADRFIRTLPEGYGTVLNEEASNISQGQKQLITIARAILADPAVLILDEATSNVDTRTEQLIQKAMHNMMKGRTSFVIAHRLSTIKNADMILVMNHGTIIEKGTHEELLAQGGFYSDLYNSQFTGKQ